MSFDDTLDLTSETCLFFQLYTYKGKMVKGDPPPFVGQTEGGGWESTPAGGAPTCPKLLKTRQL